jgi:hypothetical protein
LQIGNAVAILHVPTKEEPNVTKTFIVPEGYKGYCAACRPGVLRPGQKITNEKRGDVWVTIHADGCPGQLATTETPDIQDTLLGGGA